ncbi:type IV pilus modification protein PilV [Arenimonas aestuarii]
MNRMRPPRAPRRQSGLSLIEVLIAVLIMAVGLLGIAALQAVTLRNSQSAFDRTQATVLSYAILDAMRANATAARANSYNVGMTCTVPAAGGTLVSSDHSTWISSLKATMGDSACGSIACAANICTITIRWNDSRASGGDANETLTTTSRI